VTWSSPRSTLSRAHLKAPSSRPMFIRAKQMKNNPPVSLLRRRKKKPRKTRLFCCAILFEYRVSTRERFLTLTRNTLIRFENYTARFRTVSDRTGIRSFEERICTQSRPEPRSGVTNLIAKTNVYRYSVRDR